MVEKITNIVRPLASGPLQVVGDIAIRRRDGSLIDSGAEFYLCRCGQSGNKPFCDSSHRTAGFADPGRIQQRLPGKDTVVGQGPLTITVNTNGALVLTGPFRVEEADGTVSAPRDKGSLCRCGHSGNKPFCDATHNKVGFEAD